MAKEIEEEETSFWANVIVGVVVGTIYIICVPILFVATVVLGGAIGSRKRW